ncbi:MAG: hypothetical protein QOJ64_726 [Acidobacteriota bacterium]|jgi:hypothetical protein|nr:hypothetical protein [Acidobacteriota bacterium]
MFDFLRKQLYLTTILSLSSVFLLFQDEETNPGQAFSSIDPTLLWVLIGCSVVIYILAFAGMWKVFTKAGQPGWAVLIPVYNFIVLARVAGRPDWWFLLMVIPPINIIFLFIVFINIAKNFGRGAGFGVGLLLLSFIFFPILGFGSARYMPSQQPQFQQPPDGGGY